MNGPSAAEERLDGGRSGAIVAGHHQPGRIRVGIDSRLEAMYRGAKLLPGVRQVLERLYRRRFANERIDDLAYCGIYPDYASALAHSPHTLPVGFDHEIETERFVGLTRHVQSCDYPVLFWLEKLFGEGCESVFDLGGNIGVKYYAFRRYLDYPTQLRWTVCELPTTIRAGEAWATRNDADRRLRFTGDPADASGQDILFASGVLQYLDYTLPELLDGLAQPPRYLLINVLPLHPRRSFFTVQKSAELYAPYRIEAQADFMQSIAACGYRLDDHWDQPRRCDIPFHVEYSIEEYHGFLFARSTRQ